MGIFFQRFFFAVLLRDTVLVEGKYLMAGIHKIYSKKSVRI